MIFFTLLLVVGAVNCAVLLEKPKVASYPLVGYGSPLRAYCNRNSECRKMIVGVNKYPICRYNRCFESLEDLCNERCPRQLCHRDSLSSKCIPRQVVASDLSKYLPDLGTQLVTQNFYLDSSEELLNLPRNVEREKCRDRDCPPEHCIRLNARCLRRNSKVYVPHRQSQPAVEDLHDRFFY
ncbi:hypothetical protein DdX_01040 [Ditylenchus destructor]|uniref:Uncharacterized protein n=1 Tax=Ditylenchus destructor TaxID=166010 RepID=A0AAD4NI36_9BILA|nr:hypothetical protein DdX_01040 [Ditylenchus destructor]